MPRLTGPITTCDNVTGRSLRRPAMRPSIPCALRMNAAAASGSDVVHVTLCGGAAITEVILAP